MSRLHGLAARIRAMLQPKSAERRMDEEFQFHIEMEVDKLMREGVAPAEARRRALLTFGGIDHHREVMRDGRGARWILDIGHDARYAARALGRSPVFAVVSILTIGIGVGASAGLFSIANALVMKQLPLPSANRVVAIQESRRGNTRTEVEGDMIPFERYEAYRTRMQSALEDLAATQYRQFSLSVDGDAVSSPGSLVTRNYFKVLDLQPRAGSWFDASAASNTIVISDRIWRSRFNADRRAIGKQVLVDGRTYIVGAVAPPSFEGTTTPFIQDLWLPYDGFAFMSDPSSSDRWVGMIGRLGDGVSIERAHAAAAAAATAIPPESDQVTVQTAVVEVVTGLNGTIRKPLADVLTALVGVAILVLMIASANIAGMLLARASARTREMAIRLSIGAGRARIIRQLLTETLVLFILGGAVGVLIAYAIGRSMSTLSMPLRVPVVLNVTLDLHVLAFALGVASVTALLFGLAPAINAARTDLIPGLKDGAPGAGRKGAKLRSVFVAGQLTAAVALLMVAAVFIRSLQQTARTELGFNPEHVVVATVDVAAQGYTPDKGRAFFDAILTDLRAQPGATAVAMADRMIMGGSHYSGEMRSRPDEKDGIDVSFDRIDTSYVSTLGMRIVAGRGVTSADVDGSPPVVVVNETLAREMWPGREAVGERIWYAGDAYTVVGIVNDAKYGFITDKPQAVAMFPLTQHYRAERTIYVRTRGSNAEMLQAMRAIVRRHDSGIALQSAMPLTTSVGAALFPLKFITGLLITFGMIGLVLAVLGVYGVLSYQVGQRTREFGIRVALGATSSDVRHLVLRHGVLLAGSAILIGGLAGFWATRVLRGFVPNVPSTDVRAFVGAPAILLATAIVASYLPARRATRVDPSTALRID